MVDEIEYSENDAFDELVDKDQIVEIIGYVEAIEERRTVKNYVLFKFTLTNGKRRIMCLIWGDKIVNKYLSEIRIGRILDMDGAKSKACVVNYQRQADNYVPFELIIQANTVVTYHGDQASSTPTVTPVAQNVNFEEIGQVDGLIAIEGYIKTVFTQIPSQYQNMTFGCGSITNGIHKIMVQVAHFEPASLLLKGIAVKVTGTLSPPGVSLRIECQTMNDIVIIEEKDPMPNASLLKGVRTPKRQCKN